MMASNRAVSLAPSGALNCEVKCGVTPVGHCIEMYLPSKEKSL